MVPRMAASVWSSPVVLMFLLVFFLTVFDYSDVLLNIVVGGAVVLFKRFKTHNHGKWAGVLIKLRQRGFRTALPRIDLANLRSLPNKTYIINKDFQTLLLCVSRKSCCSEWIIMQNQEFHLVVIVSYFRHSLVSEVSFAVIFLINFFF